MKELNREYTLLFNGISDTISEIDRLKAKLEALQQAAEELVLGAEEESAKEERMLWMQEKREVS